MTSSTPSRSRGRRRVASACPILAVILAAAVAFRPGAGIGRTGAATALPTVPGGFLESATTGLIRPRLSIAEIQALLPARGAFAFPPPYGTTGVRLTNADDCAGGDCVDYVGYFYWRNINDHVGQDEMLILLGLDRARGGPGPSLFRYDKTADRVAGPEPLFDPSSPLSWRSGEGWYWSATRPTVLYIDDGPQMLRFDVASRQFQKVFDVRPPFGQD